MTLSESEPTMTRAAPAHAPADQHSALVAEVLAAAGGDARKAIIGLVLGQRQLETEAAGAISAGYVRRELRR